MIVDRQAADWLLDRHGIRFFPAVNAPVQPIALSSKFEAHSQHVPGQFMPLGAYSYSHSFFENVSRIGRYCSIGTGVKTMGDGHPTDWISSSPAFYKPRRSRLWNGQRTDFPAFDPVGDPIKIGHDVWIGDDVLLANGITIGTGSVVASRAVVTADVPPYAIVGGTPAKLIRWRFDTAIIDRFLASEWWKWPLKTWCDVDPTNVTAFLDQVENLSANVAPLEEKRHTAKDLLTEYASS